MLDEMTQMLNDDAQIRAWDPRPMRAHLPTLVADARAHEFFRTDIKDYYEMAREFIRMMNELLDKCDRLQEKDK